MWQLCQSRTNHDYDNHYGRLIYEVSKPLTWLIIPIITLSSLRPVWDCFYQSPGQPMAYKTLRGEQVTINRQGLYGLIRSVWQHRCRAMTLSH
jgi:hypothetical protein